MSFIRLATRNLTRPRLALAVPRTQASVPWRAGFAAAAGLTKDTIETRVLDVFKGFEKVNPSKVRFKIFTPADFTIKLLGQACSYIIIYGRPRTG